MSALRDRLRDLIHESAAEHPQIGPLEKSTKWGDESFTPARKNTGSSVRIQPRANGDVGLMFICTTGLVGRISQTYPGLFKIEGQRALIFHDISAIPLAETKHAIAMALTHKLR
jgi:hypothetical protein